MMKVLAIDVGTASLSAAVAEKHENGKFFVRDVWRFLYDSSDSKNASRILLKNLEKIFLSSSKSHLNIQRVAVGFSSPLHLEKPINAEFLRPYPSEPITKEEMQSAVQNLKNRGGDEGVAALACNIFETKINGYATENPIGYRGEVLEIKANLLMLSPRLKNYLDEMKDKYFPASEFSFFSDSSILKKAISRFFSPNNDFIVLDLGGEVSVFGDFSFPFGLRELERRVGSFLHRFSLGHLDYPQERFVNRVLKSHAESLRNIIGGRKFGKIFLTGAGANIPHFYEIVKKVGDVKKLEAQDFIKIFGAFGALSGGKDAVLAALISNYERV